MEAPFSQRPIVFYGGKWYEVTGVRLAEPGELILVSDAEGTPDVQRCAPNPGRHQYAILSPLIRVEKPRQLDDGSLLAPTDGGPGR